MAARFDALETRMTAREARFDAFKDQLKAELMAELKALAYKLHRR